MLWSLVSVQRSCGGMKLWRIEKPPRLKFYPLQVFRKEMGNGTTDFPGLPSLRPAFVYNNKRPVILSFRSFRSTEPRLFSPSSTCTSYRLLDMLRNRLFPSCVLPMPCSSFLCKLIKEWRSMKVVKHPQYCLFTRETRALADRFSLHNWRFMSQKARRTRYFARVCLAWLRKRLLCRLNLYVGGLCGSVTVDSSRLILKTTPRNKS